jgi:hypothetical protein
MHILSRYRWSRIAQPNSLWLLSALGLALLVCIPLVFASAQKTPPVAAKQRASDSPSWSVCDSSSAGIKVTDASGLVYICGESGGPEIKKDKAATSTSATIALEPASSASSSGSADAPAPVENPVKPPTISWDGQQLTIDADNSTLSEILLGIRARTGASIDMPPSTAAEKVFVHLGPAPIREVLSSLLYGTDFDYVIQASDTDERGLRSVTLTEREKGDKADVVTASDALGQPRQRLMKGYSAPGKRDFQVAAETAAESSASPQTESAAAEVSPPASPEPAPAGAEPAATVAQGASSADSPASGSADAMVAGANQSLNRPALTSSGDSNSSGMSSVSEMEQNLLHMYQQRQQIQALQNTQPPGK